jgi:hypothetical protein
MSDRAVLLYCGHHKCATRWLVDIITDVCRRAGLEFYEAHNAGMFNRDLGSFLRERPVDFLAYTNARIEFLRDVGNRVGFHVIRDPRDLLVSAYFSHLHSHPIDGWSALEEHRRRLRSCSEEEGLNLELDFTENVFTALSGWDYNQAGMLELKMEQLIPNAYEGLVDVFLHLSLVDPEEVPLEVELQRIFDRQATRPATPRPGASGTASRIERCELLQIINAHRFARKAGGRQVGQEDSHSHYRRGEAGDWRHHFSPQLAARFAERYGSLLFKLGYESDEEWWRKVGQA